MALLPIIRDFTDQSKGAAIPTDDRLSDFGVEGLRIEQEPIHVVYDVRN